MKAYFFKFPSEFAGAAGWMLFCLFVFEFVLVDKFTVITRLYEPHGACSFKYCGYSSCIGNELWFLLIQLC